MKTANLPNKIAMRIRRSKANVFIPSDFLDLSGYDQVLRVLRNMVRANQLIKIGQGIYAKTKTYSDGIIAPVSFIGNLASEALNKYGVKTGDSSWTKAYNTGKTTQVPTGRLIAVNRRVRRKIGYNGYSVNFEMMNSRQGKRILA
ncbi:MAG: hypothetical protein FWF23_00440 [Alphaproteobacteria bacterium]|nr:hypothetical protein [Alphaproteobacteria bacterium]MCL2505079.1 hypothetical protein [Alphaproteobacteria bacterium]